MFSDLTKVVAILITCIVMYLLGASINISENDRFGRRLAKRFVKTILILTGSFGALPTTFVMILTLMRF